jgi:hypothetical protein
MAELDIALFDTRDAEDEIALGQLGAATVLVWSSLPDGIKVDLRHTAKMIAGVRTVPDAEARLERLIEHHSDR